MRTRILAGDADWENMKRYAVYKTASAPASRTTGSIAFAIAAIAFLAKRFGLIDADVFVLSLAVAGAVALVALAMAIFAFHRIWSYGGPGVPSALGGAVIGLFALAAPVLVIGMLVANPGLPDISTDRADPPEVKGQTVAEEQPFLDWSHTRLEQEVWPLISQLSQSAALSVLRSETGSADIVPRRYRIAPGQLHVATAKALEDLNWPVVDELPPDLLDAATRLQAEGTTQILGLKFDVALRIRPDPVGALLDVRSRSRTPLRDLSGNAENIRSVFDEIDRVLLETYGDLARLSVEESETAEDLQIEPLEEQRDVVPLPGFKPYFEDEEQLAPGDDVTSDLEG